jgi:hypothetical protein
MHPPRYVVAQRALSLAAALLLARTAFWLQGQLIEAAVVIPAIGIAWIGALRWVRVSRLPLLTDAERLAQISPELQKMVVHATREAMAEIELMKKADARPQEIEASPKIERLVRQEQSLLYDAPPDYIPAHMVAARLQMLMGWANEGFTVTETEIAEQFPLGEPPKGSLKP